jgi:hypothetical protein
MDELSPQALEQSADFDRPDQVSLRRWFSAYALYMLAICVPLGLLIAAENWSWSQWVHQSAQTLSQTSEATKLLFFLAYMSICCTFLPLPTGWMVAALASHEAAIAQGLSSNELVVALATTFIVGAVGGLGSSMANLNDYHLFTWLLRSRRVAKVRNTRTYRAAARWFARRDRKSVV